MESQSFTNVQLSPHPTARSASLAKTNIPAGSIIISVPAFTFALLSAEKGRRCDACGRNSHDAGQLKKCSGCASYFYCDTNCQTMHWNIEHKRICKLFNQMDAAIGSRQMAQYERMDTLLLSHFLSRINSSRNPNETSSSGNDDSPLSVFLSLLPGPGKPLRVVDTIPESLNRDRKLTTAIYSRFHNNNFAIHSHMTTFGHGVFPLSSRLFNHSCMPNAAPRYVLHRAQYPLMEVVALRDIEVGEEICVPYVDPALTQSRHQMFQYTYGFTCECSSCIVLRKLGQPPEPPQSEDALRTIGETLQQFVGVGKKLGKTLPAPSLANLPTSIHCVLHELYMEQLSEQFSKSSHEGDYGLALESGISLLALYLLVYPQNYPQIGLHLLELAKTRWNAIVSSSAPPTIEASAQVRLVSSHARHILQIYGREGDEGGPLTEVQNLEALVDQ